MNQAGSVTSFAGMLAGVCSDGTVRSIYRTVGNNGGFRANSLVESIDLLDAMSVAELHDTWPTSQTFRDIPVDQDIAITEGNDSFQPLPQPCVGDKSQ